MQATMREPGAVAAGFILLPVYEYCLKVKKVKPCNVADIKMATRLLKFLLSTSALQRGAKDEATSIAHAIQISVSFYRLSKKSCVSRSVMLWQCCQVRNIPAVCQLGYSEKLKQFHTWVEVDSIPVNDTADVANRYACFDKPLISSPNVT